MFFGSKKKFLKFSIENQKCVKTTENFQKPIIRVKQSSKNQRKFYEISHRENEDLVNQKLNLRDALCFNL